MAFVLTFLIRRLAQGVVIVLLVTFLIFTLLRVIPGDPVRIMLGPSTTQAVPTTTRSSSTPAIPTPRRS